MTSCLNGTGAGSNGADSRVFAVEVGAAGWWDRGRGLWAPPPPRRPRRGGRPERASVFNSGLAGAERDDAPDRIVRRDPDGHAVARHDLDAKAPHPAAQLGQDFMAGIDLHAIKAAAVNGDYRALDINEVVLAQIRCSFRPFSVSQVGGGGYREPGGRAMGQMGQMGQVGQMGDHVGQGCCHVLD